jgi:hypothetical protein
MARIVDVLLDLSFLPACSRIAELGLKDIVAGHGAETRIYIALFANANAINRHLHVIVNATTRNALEDAEPVPMRIKQHPLPDSAFP